MQISFPSYYGLYFMGAIAIIICLVYIFAGREVFSKRESGEDFIPWQGDLPERISSGKQDYQLQEPGFTKVKTVDFEAMKLPIPNTDAKQSRLEETKILFGDLPLEALGTADQTEAALLLPNLTEQQISPEEESLHETIVLDKSNLNGEQTAVDELHETKVISTAVLPIGEDLVAADLPAEMPQTEGPQPFGFKMCWLAVAGADQMQVLHSLGLTNIREATWQEGVAAAYGEAGSREVFVTPTVNNWILVIGRALWNKMDLNCRLEDHIWFQHLLSELSEVHYYSTHRTMGNHAWVKGKKGHIVRGYGYSGELGEVLWCVGEPTSQEKMLRFNFYTPDNQGSGNLRYPEEQDVLILAALWSVDTTFENVKVGEEPCYIGTLPE